MITLPDGWTQVESPATHPDAKIYEGPCAVCKTVIRRSTCHFETRKIQVCSNECKGKALEPERDSVRWKKGRAFVYRPDHPYAKKEKKMSGYVLRSRAMMEDHLGRILEPSEIVHHKNDDCTDDQLDNFELTNRSDHRSHHAKKEIEQYGTTARWK